MVMDSTTNNTEIDLSSIRTNPLNFFAQTSEEESFIQSQMVAIKRDGQIEPVIVYFDDEIDDEKVYTLLGGERRFKALLRLHKEDPNSFDSIQAKVINRPETKEEEVRTIMSLNANRDSLAVKWEVIHRLHDMWEKREEFNINFSGRFEEWAEQMSGWKQRTITRYWKMTEPPVDKRPSANQQKAANPYRQFSKSIIKKSDDLARFDLKQDLSLTLRFQDDQEQIRFIKDLLSSRSLDEDTKNALSSLFKEYSTGKGEEENA